MELNGRIINGQKADMGQYPGLCALRSANGAARCTAELIAPNWALTAGHCQPENGQLLICGCADLRSSECQRRTVATGYLHELYEDWSEGHDLALVRIADPMLGIMPIPLSGESVVGSPVHVAGYGRTCSNCATSPVLLENGNPMTLISNAVCSLYYPGSITHSMLCARSAGSDAAPGDSGGFLGQEIGGVLHQIGVVSWGRDCTAADPGGNPTETCVGVYGSLAGEVDGIRACIQE
jgi:secreted trypsin-like serine protease